MILDRFGNEVPLRYVRTTIGFVPQQVDDDTLFEVDAPRLPDRKAIVLGDQVDDPIVARRR